MPNDRGLWIAAIAISTAAMPTSECIAATSSGICVICTRRATTAPIAPPTAIAGEDPADVTRRRVDERKRDDHGDRHADDAEQVAAARRRRVRQALQREDEADRRDQIPEGDLIGAHVAALVPLLGPLGFAFGSFLREHFQHPLRHEEAAERR